MALSPLRPFARWARALKVVLAVAAGAPIFGCELQEISLADPSDIVIAEVVLQVGADVQLAWLHRTRGATDDQTVPGARIVVTSEDGSFELLAAPDSICQITSPETAGIPHGSCYATPAGRAPVVRPGETYTLAITLAGGGRMTGVTTVPGPYDMVRPVADVCQLAPLTNLEIEWTPSFGAWVYAGETLLSGVRPALEAQGIHVERDPLRLFGLAISRDDTTMRFPAEFGLFDRGDDDLLPALIALQNGLPAGIAADIIIAAADRNYVNWERGGNFNPSGPVRVPSIQGDGTGVFASIFPKYRHVVSGTNERLPPC